jgi:hypothetical protein
MQRTVLMRRYFSALRKFQIEKAVMVWNAVGGFGIINDDKAVVIIVV